MKEFIIIFYKILLLEHSATEVYSTRHEMMGWFSWEMCYIFSIAENNFIDIICLLLLPNDSYFSFSWYLYFYLTILIFYSFLKLSSGALRVKILSMWVSTHLHASISPLSCMLYLAGWYMYQFLLKEGLW